MSEKPDLEKAPISLPQPVRLLLALSALCASQNPPESSQPSIPSSNVSVNQWYKAQSTTWVKSICKIIELDFGLLPPSALREGIEESAKDQVGEWSDEQKARMAEVLLEASLAASKGESGQAGAGTTPKKDDKSDVEKEQLRYTPLARAWSYHALEILCLPAKDLLPKAEKDLSIKLFTAMKASTEGSQDKQNEQVEAARAAKSHGWGGLLGKRLATGAGVVAGGILVGVTGGLAAPAIAALLAPLGIGGLLAGGAAPVVLGTLFGVGGGGLAGRRVRERWKGVEEFGFIEVGAGTRATREEVSDLKEARRRLKGSKEDYEKEVEEQRQELQAAQSAGQTDQDEKTSLKQGETGEKEEVPEGMEGPETEDTGVNRMDLEKRLLNLSLNGGVVPGGEGSPVTSPTVATPRSSISSESGLPTLDDTVDEKSITEEKKRVPSLTATIVVPGLMVISKTEAITAWRSICSDGSRRAGIIDDEGAILGDGRPIPYEPRRKSVSHSSTSTPRQSVDLGNRPSDIAEVAQAGEEVGKTEKAEGGAPGGSAVDLAATPAASGMGKVKKVGLRDGRDVYLLRFETEKMLSTGRAFEGFVGKKIKGKIKGKVKGEIIKRTALGAYFAAVKLPIMAYKMATIGLDNTWIQAVDRAKKAGRLLGEVIEKKVQGERPVVLVGTSLGAYTVLEALLYLSSLPPPPGVRGTVPAYVESATLISMPIAPTEDEWAKCRSVVARRLVNAYSDQDIVLATVARLHEVVSRAATLSSGMTPAGLAPVEQAGVEDVDISSVLEGHLEVQAKLGDIMDLIGIDD